MQEMTLRGFLARFKQIRQYDLSRRFCFILGAGASMASGIPGAAGLARTWLRETYETSTEADTKTFEAWMKDEDHGIADFDPNDLGAMYFKVFSRRFCQEPEEGSRYLEQLIEKGKPSYGYYVLAYVLANTPHNLVITVNFDNLIADALFLFSRSHPILCGHDYVAPLMPTTPHRPMVIKVHHDIFLNPLNDPEAMSSLGKEFAKKLPEFLNRYTPIVIGYGGNDGSLMKALSDMDKILGGIYWCIREGEAVPAPVEELLLKRNGTLVRIPDFDSFMTQLGAELGFAFDEADLVEKYRTDLQTVVSRQDQVAQGAVRFSEGNMTEEAKDTLRALEETGSRERKHWWSYQVQIDKETDSKKKDRLYLESIKALPTSSPLLGNYAVFLKNVRKDYDQAESYYKRAIEADPNHAINLGNYANFLNTVRKDYDQAESYYKRAIEADPNEANNLGNYALFLENVRKDYDQAESYYKRAIEADPNHAINLGNYANFLNTVRKDYDQAESYYKRSIEADPDDANKLGNYALFLENVRKDYDQAESYYKRSIEADPDDANSLGNCAGFLFARGSEDADEWAGRAIENANENEKPLLVEVTFYRYANGNAEKRNANLQELYALLLDGVRSLNWDLSRNIERAKEQKHPEIEWLSKLAMVINDEMPIETLDKWPAWRNVRKSD